MSRPEARRSPHVREGKPSPPAGPGGERGAADSPSRSSTDHRGWAAAAFIWIVAFLFLASLMVFDLIAMLF